MRRSDIGLLGFGALCAAAISASALGGCRSDDSSASSRSDGAGAAGNTSGGAGAGNGIGNGGGGDGGDVSTGTSMGGGGGGEGGSAPDLPVTTIEQITKGAVGNQIDVQLKGVIAMSRKFFVTDTSSGGCLWGVFLSSPDLPNNETAPNSGILAVAFGSPARTDGSGEPVCPDIEKESPGDPFPDDVKPGDVLDVTGETSYFSLTQCKDACGDTVCNAQTENAQNCRNDCGTSPILIAESGIGQYQLAEVSKVTRTGAAPVPTPHALTPEEVLLLSAPGDEHKAFHDQWGGVKVRIEGAYAPRLQTNSMGNPTVVGSFGNIHLDEGPVQIGDKIYFVNGSQNACHQGPLYPDTSVEFTRIDGFSYKNFCTWSIQPMNKCTDVAPASADCTGGLMCE